MEMVVFIVIFIIAWKIGLIIMNKIDLFLEKDQNYPISILENREDIIKIACENPIVLTSIFQKIEKHEKEFKEISFHFYTGCREDSEKAFANGSYDIIILMKEPSLKDYGCYRKKKKSFIPTSLSYPLSGVVIEPIEKQNKDMYIFLNEKYITENKRKIFSNM